MSDLEQSGYRRSQRDPTVISRRLVHEDRYGWFSEIQTDLVDVFADRFQPRAVPQTTLAVLPDAKGNGLTNAIIRYEISQRIPATSNRPATARRLASVVLKNYFRTHVGFSFESQRVEADRDAITDILRVINGPRIRPGKVSHVSFGSFPADFEGVD